MVCEMIRLQDQRKVAVEVIDSNFNLKQKKTPNPPDCPKKRPKFCPMMMDNFDGLGYGKNSDKVNFRR